LAGKIGSCCGSDAQYDRGDSENAEDGLAAALKAYKESFRPFMEQAQKVVLEESRRGNML
jgi:hypothetical protein